MTLSRQSIHVLLPKDCHSLLFFVAIVSFRKSSPVLSLSTSKRSDGSYPIYANESVMSQKDHGTCIAPVQKKLCWNCDVGMSVLPIEFVVIIGIMQKIQDHEFMGEYFFSE
jgi:hypothetical protein